MNKLIASLVLVCHFINSNGQTNYDELVHLSRDFFSPALIGIEDDVLSQTQVNVLMGHGMTLRRGDLLNFGASYNYLQLETDNASHPSLHIHNLGLGADYLRYWKKPNWASTISIGLNLVSDFQKLTPSSYQTTVSGLLHYGKSDDFVLTFGLLFSDQPFGPWFFPVVGLDWRPTEKLYLSTILFSHVYLEYALKPQQWYIGVDCREMGSSFSITNFASEQNSYITSLSNRFPYYPFTASIYSDFYFKKYFTAFVKTGLLFSRAYEHYTNAHTPLTESIYFSAVDPGLYINLGLAIRLRKF